MVLPWAEAGHECYIVDIQHRSRETTSVGRGSITRVPADILEYELPRETLGVFSFPPCTHLAASGARWWAKKGPKVFREAIRLVEQCRYLIDEAQFGFIENPVGRLSTYWRKPDHTFDPCDYGDPYTKKTCLWTYGSFVMPPKTPVPPTLGSKMHRISPGPNRANLRSETPMGFARAVFLANNPKD
jgi:hypothetical protein